MCTGGTKTSPQVCSSASKYYNNLLERCRAIATNFTPPTLLDQSTGYFSYADLDTTAHEIRLICPLPCQAADGTKCELILANLEEKPTYTTLSYEWGRSALVTSESRSMAKNILSVRISGGCYIIFVWRIADRRRGLMRIAYILINLEQNTAES